MSPSIVHKVIHVVILYLPAFTKILLYHAAIASITASLPSVSFMIISYDPAHQEPPHIAQRDIFVLVLPLPNKTDIVHGVVLTSPGVSDK